MKLFSSFFAKDVSRTVDSANLYELCGKQALNRAFYDGKHVPHRAIHAETSIVVFELPESYASHLELAILHVWMCKLRLSKEAEGRGRFLDQVLERMWEHVGRSLTGAGVGSIVCERVQLPNGCIRGFAQAPVVRMDKFLKEIQQSAFGSFVSYDHALTRMRDLKEAKDSNSTDPLMSALSNSLYGEDPPRRFKQLAALSSYVLSQMEIIDKMPLDNLKTAKFKFSDPALFS